MDFMDEKLVGGQRIRLLTVVDNHSRESLAIEFGQWLTENHVVLGLEQITMQRGKQKSIWVDGALIGRRGHRGSRANPTPATWRPRCVPPLRAASAREDAPSQGRVGEPRELARLARSRGAARAAIRRGRTPQLS